MTIKILTALDSPDLSIFEPLQHHLTVPSLLVGDTTGSVWVDDPQQPRAALCRAGGRYYLAGDASNAEFNAALKAYFDEIYQTGRGSYTLCFSEVAGRAEQLETVFAGRYLIPGTRHYYTLKPGQLIQPEKPLEGMTIVPIDDDLLSRTELVGYDELEEELQSERTSVEEFLARSVGFVALAGDEIAGMVTSEFNTGTRTELGINTMSQYRRHGVASTLAATFAESMFAQGFDVLGWHCWDTNAASMATALKVGCVFDHAYPCHFALFDPIDNLAVNGEVRFRHGDYAEAVTWFERAFAQGAAKWWAYFVAAQAYLKLEQVDEAFAKLERALELDAAAVAGLQPAAYFSALHDDPRWPAVAAQLTTL